MFIIEKSQKLVLQLDGEAPYVYKDPVQQPIAPPYASFMHYKPLDDKLMESIKNFFTTSPDALNLDKMIEKLAIVDDKAKTPKNNNITEATTSLQPPTSFQDFNNKIEEEHANVSHETFSQPLQILCDELEQVNLNQDNADLEEDHEDLIQTFCELEIGENSAEETCVGDESEIIKIIKKALMANEPFVATDDFLAQIDRVLNLESKKDLNFRCMCTEDSDLE